MVRSNQHKATLILCLSAVGFFASVPFGHTFTGGLLASVWGAAVVGGLADWFAVSALFRKPLYIPWRTAIIPRNREKILQAMVEIVEKELLTKENVKEKLAHYNISQVIIDYLEQRGGRVSTQKMFHRVCLDLLRRLDPAELAQVAEFMLESSVRQVRVVPVFVQMLEWSFTHGYDEKMINFIITEIIQLIKLRQMRNLLSTLFSEAKVVYESDIFSRRALNWLLDQSGYSTDKLASMAQAELVDFLEGLFDNSHPLRQQLKVRLDKITRDLLTDTSYQAKMEGWKMELLSSNFDLKSQINSFLHRLSEDAVNASETSRWLKLMNRQIDELLSAFKRDGAIQEKIDGVIKQALLDLLEVHQDAIGGLIREKLNAYSDDMLADFIESKVGDDLQMIRINGSVVGAFVGLVIYLTTFWL